MLSVGLAWLGLWRTRARLAGLLAIGVGIASPLLDRPADVLVSADARLIAVRTEARAYVQQARGGSRFLRDAWQQYWGMDELQPLPEGEETVPGGIACGADTCVLQPRQEATRALLVRGPGRPVDCRGIGVVISLEPAQRLCPHPWPALADRFTVWRDGAVAIWLDPDGVRVLTDRALRGARPWVPPVPTPHRRSRPSLLPPPKAEGAGADD